MNMPCPSERRPQRDAAASLNAERETMCLLHGSAGSGTLWRELQGVLAPHFQVIAPDLIGYGGSPPWPQGKPLRLADEVENVKRQLRDADRQIHLVGYSYGGAVALAFACAAPEQIRSLTLIEPVYFAALRDTGDAGDAAMHAEFAGVQARFVEAIQRNELAAAMRDFIDFWTGTGAWGRLSPALHNAMLGFAAKIQLDWAACFAAEPCTDRLAALGHKTTLVRGERSPAPMLALVEALHRVMPGSRRQVAHEANHLLPITHCRWLAELLLPHARRTAVCVAP